MKTYKKEGIESVFKHNNLCCVVFFAKIGFRCGYVAVDAASPLCYINYKHKILSEIEVYGGLSYSATHKRFSEIARENNINSVWWFGFDCNSYKSYVTKEFFEQECKKVADQLVKMDKELKIVKIDKELNKQIEESVNYENMTTKEVDDYVSTIQREL